MGYLCAPTQKTSVSGTGDSFLKMSYNIKTSQTENKLKKDIKSEKKR